MNDEGVDTMEITIMIGMSGSGKSSAMRTLEDLGYMCVDNLPPSMLKQFVNQVIESNEFKQVAVELNTKYYTVGAIVEVIEELKQLSNMQLNLIFLEASDESLVSRYKETRRVHPLLSANQTLQEAIRYERDILHKIKQIPGMIVIDTSNFTSKELSNYITKMLGDDEGKNIIVNFMSFGFKYGMPQDADFVIDVRYLPNPFYIDTLKAKSGLDDEVYTYVFDQEKSQALYKKLKALLDDVLEGFVSEGRRHAIIAIGCTGGQHRSVSFARRLTKEYESQYHTILFNRDILKNKH